MTLHSHAKKPKSGTWLVSCDVCGIIHLNTQIKKRWDNLYVCESDWERDHPQKNIKLPNERIAPPFERVESVDGTGNSFIPLCTVFGNQAVAGAAVAGCSIVGTWRLVDNGGSLLVPPVNPIPQDPNYGYLIYLNNYQGANNSTTFTDASPIERGITAFGNARISTASQIFGDSSAFFDGSGDYLQLALVSSLPITVSFNTVWSMGMWFKPSETTSSNPSFDNTRLFVNSGSNEYIQQHFYYSEALAGRSIFGYTDNNTTFPGGEGISPMTAGNWYYLFMKNTPGSDLFEWWLGEDGGTLTLQNTSTKRGLRIDQFGDAGNLPPNNEYIGYIGPTRIYSGYADEPTFPTALFPDTGPPAPPPPPVIGYRYWRLVNLTIPGGSFLEISEVRLTESGIDVTTGTISSSSSPLSGTVGDLYDGNLFTKCYWTETVAENPGFFIAWDYGAGNEKEITGFKQGGFDTSSRYIEACTCQYSSDGISWTTLGSASGLTYPGNNALSSNILFA